MHAVSLAAFIVCATATTILIGQSQAQETLPELPTPNAVMEADPQPPFTYWAPENSTIRNHPNVKGIWIAETDGQERHFYFGDQCHASEFQQFVGKTLDALPEKPANANWRLACTTCAVTGDLHRDRLNVSYVEDSKVIEKVFCS